MAGMPPRSRSFRPGQLVRWHYPRMAFALGWFDEFGPGPFEVIGHTPDGSLLVESVAGQRLLDPAWVGLADRNGSA